MRASSFSFKQFTVFHDKCAMKVGTDGVLLGAWADVSNVNSVLDIGTGSGLIALMLAQRCDATITAIDIESSAIVQANINALNSPWTERISNIEISLQQFVQNAKQQFDLIVSNPPFFKNALPNPDSKRTLARHAETHFHNELILSAKKLLNTNGRLCLILPVDEGNECLRFATEQALFCTKKVLVYPKPDSVAKRLLLEFSAVYSTQVVSELTIESEIRHEYTQDFSNLVKDFYLKL
ncbi:MAG: methyltransferase [Paludibacter sp.]|nr:methyltransferase [Paludibacter sp.]